MATGRVVGLEERDIWRGAVHALRSKCCMEKNGRIQFLKEEVQPEYL
jgi:hypothetical protein